MAGIRRLELAVLLPQSETIVEFTQQLTESTGIGAVTTSLLHAEQRVCFIAVTIEGHDVEYESLRDRIRERGGVAHESLEVSYGSPVPEPNDSYNVDLEWKAIEHEHELEP
ncbi:DUF211 domain-containing protein [Natrinema pallidum]|uniref:Uncharacterized protein n=1 Tax=Natrinema pallidum DSM 3751 TaxID=1227495 RepID=L9YDB8_9EURY|nr:DUF211 domain-containing protein [Natrinema pallidum]ELY72030.1 hypothetical protein C487_19483 [Natrinema pallidum DSM 3751]